MITLPDLAIRVAPAPTRDPLPGREIEVARLGAAWSAAATGVPAVLLIVGEAGVGKTRLAQEAIALAESTGGLVLQARCYAAERSLFLQPSLTRSPGSLQRCARIGYGDSRGPVRPRSPACHPGPVTSSIHHRLDGPPRKRSSGVPFRTSLTC